MKSEFSDYIELYRKNPEELIRLADIKCREIHGDNVYVRGLIEFSNNCLMDCLYCGIRKSNIKVNRYRMTADEIVETAKKAYSIGIRTFVLQGGEDGSFPDDVLEEIVSRIKNETSHETAITLSVGIRPMESYLRLKKAGADRYLIRFETSDSEIYSRIKLGQNLDRRIQAIRELKSAGFETGSGFMTSLSGETEDTVINNALLCAELELDMVGIGPFIPHPDTPLHSDIKPDLEKTIKAVALVRLMLPYAHMPATTAAGSADPMGREKILNAGANVVMPNLTPEKYKKDYLLYPGKICLDEDFVKCLGCLSGRTGYSNKKLDLSVAGSLKRGGI